MKIITVPVMEENIAARGRRVRETIPEYVGTEVHHSLYLPSDWEICKRYPVIVEYTGNYHAPSGSTGEVKDANLGYGLSLGKGFIWVVLPFISIDHKHNQRTWWGDEQATVEYCKIAIPRICEQYGGDKDNIFICGFSRGAIAVNYIGLYDDEISMLWRGFITNDHYDGVLEWKNTCWGFPLAKYRKTARSRLKRVGMRSVLIMQNDSSRSLVVIREYIGNDNNYGDFTFIYIPITKIFDVIPNEFFISSHTDKWILFDNEYAFKAREWLLQFLQ